TGTSTRSAGSSERAYARPVPREHLALRLLSRFGRSRTPEDTSGKGRAFAQEVRTMKYFGRTAAALAVAVCLAPAVPAHAQIEREKSVFVLEQPMEIGAYVVPPGSYMIKVVKLSYNRNVVQVTTPDGRKVVASALATPHPKKVDETIPNTRFVY